MSKRKLILLVLFVMSISSLFVVKGIYGYFYKITNPVANYLSIEQNTTYTVVRQTMNLDGLSYTTYDTSTPVTVPIGTTVSPTPLPIEGFDTPSTQSVLINSFDNTVITYQYPRKQYTLTINNSSHVTTNTPSGTYYYGQEIHLVADADDGAGSPFVKWSNNETNRDYTFTLTNNITIGPLYADTYTITYVPNNGDASFTELIVQNNPITEFPDVEYNDCIGSTGNYNTRQCTEAYELIGWYKEPTFVNKVDETFVPTGDITLYAKWEKIYFREDGPVVFDGDDIIYTGVKLFSEENARKNFIVTFTVDSYTGYNPTNNTDKRATIFTDMNERGDPYYGVQFFKDDKNYALNINASNNANDRMKDYDTDYDTGQNVILKRENGIIYYSYDDGLTFTQTKDFSSFTSYFNNEATFGGGLDKNLNPYRFLIGTLSNMSVELYDPPKYTIHFDANGGTGLMLDQNVELGTSATLSPNSFTNTGYVFAGWNTAANGTGTSYPNNYAINSDLGNDGDVITLYAQWAPPPSYFVHFDANGGTGTMNNQEFQIDDSAEPLTANAFTRTNYVFKGWNTAADGSGTHYDDEESVRNLSLTANDVVTLYAEWWKIEYNHPGDAVFDGTSSTFIDTGVNIFSTANKNKDFEIRFTFKSVDSDQLAFFPGTQKQPTIFNAKDESNNKYPGINVRFNGDINILYGTHRWGGSTSNIPGSGINVSNAPIEFIIRRKSKDNNKVITFEYKYEGFDSGESEIINQGKWTLNQPFATNVAFGGYFDGNNIPGRFFKGTLADMSIIMEE